MEILQQTNKYLESLGSKVEKQKSSNKEAKKKQGVSTEDGGAVHDENN